MKRRYFLKQTAKLTAGGLITASMIGVLGCKSLHDFYSFDGSLRNGISWTNFQLSINLGSQGTYDTVHATSPSVINVGGVGKMWYAGRSGGIDRIIYAESR